MTAVGLALAAGLAVLLWPGRHASSPRRDPSTTGRPRWWAAADGGSQPLDGSSGASPGASLARPADPGQAPPGRWVGAVVGRLPRRPGGATSPEAGEVADALVLLALALRSGLGLAEALREVQLGSGGRVRRDLASVVAALQWARSAPEAWAFASPVWRQVAQAWEVATQTGSAPADQVERVAQRLREVQERDRERRAARAGVLLVLPLGFGFLPAFVCTAVVPVVLAVASGVVGG